MRVPPLDVLTEPCREYLDDGLVGVDERLDWELQPLKSLVDQVSEAFGGLPGWKRYELLRLVQREVLCGSGKNRTFEELVAEASRLLNMG